MGLVAPPPLIINLHVTVMIHDIVIIIWEDHVYEQFYTLLLIWNKWILSYVLCLSYIPSPLPWPRLFMVGIDMLGGGGYIT